MISTSSSVVSRVFTQPNTTSTAVTSSIYTHYNRNMDATAYSPLDIFRLTATAIVFIATIVGNIAAIYFISRNKEWRSLKNYYYGYYLINLNIADLLVAIFCIPFTVVYYESKKWRFGYLFCKVMPTTQVISVSASICTLAVITWERYRALIYPMCPRSTVFGLRVRLLLIWLWAIVVGAPSLYAYELDETRTMYQCMENWPNHAQRQSYTIFIFLFNYAIPLAFMFVSYVIIYRKLKRGETPYSRSRVLQNQFVKLMIMLIASFAVCYLPGHVCFFLLDFGSGTNNKTFTTVITFAHLLTWINSCLNPFFYCAIGGFIRRRKEQTRRASKHSTASLMGESFRRTSNPEEQNRHEMFVLPNVLNNNNNQRNLKPCAESSI